LRNRGTPAKNGRTLGFLEFQGIIALISKVREDWIKKWSIFYAKFDKRFRVSYTEIKNRSIFKRATDRHAYRTPRA